MERDIETMEDAHTNQGTITQVSVPPGLASGSSASIYELVHTIHARNAELEAERTGELLKRINLLERIKAWQEVGKYTDKIINRSYAGQPIPTCQAMVDEFLSRYSETSEHLMAQVMPPRRTALEQREIEDSHTYQMLRANIISRNSHIEQLNITLFDHSQLLRDIQRQLASSNGDGSMSTISDQEVKILQSRAAEIEVHRQEVAQLRTENTQLNELVTQQCQEVARHAQQYQAQAQLAAQYHADYTAYRTENQQLRQTIKDLCERQWPTHQQQNMSPRQTAQPGIPTHTLTRARSRIPLMSTSNVGQVLVNQRGLTASRSVPSFAPVQSEPHGQQIHPSSASTHVSRPQPSHSSGASIRTVTTPSSHGQQAQTTAGQSASGQIGHHVTPGSASAKPIVPSGASARSLASRSGHAQLGLQTRPSSESILSQSQRPPWDFSTTSTRAGSGAARMIVPQSSHGDMRSLYQQHDPFDMRADPSLATSSRGQSTSPTRGGSLKKKIGNLFRPSQQQTSPRRDATSQAANILESTPVPVAGPATATLVLAPSTPSTARPGSPLRTERSAASLRDAKDRPLPALPKK